MDGERVGMMDRISKGWIFLKIGKKGKAKQKLIEGSKSLSKGHKRPIEQKASKNLNF